MIPAENIPEEKTAPLTPEQLKEYKTPYREFQDETIKKLKEHPTYANSEIKTFHPYKTSNNLNVLHIHPAGTNFVKIVHGQTFKSPEGVVGGGEGDPKQRLTNMELGEDFRKILKMPGIPISIVSHHGVKNDPLLHPDIHGLVIAPFDDSVQPLIDLADPTPPREKLDKIPVQDIIMHDLFERLGFEDQHLGNKVTDKNGRLLVNDLEYLFNPKNPHPLAAHIKNSALSNYLMGRPDYKNLTIDKNTLRHFVKHEDALLESLDKHLPTSYNKEEVRAIKKHVMETLLLYLRHAKRDKIPLKDLHEDHDNLIQQQLNEHNELLKRLSEEKTVRPVVLPKRY